MQKSATKSFMSKATTALLAIALSLPLTACHRVVAANDVAGECDHPAKPAKPYTDERVALFILEQGKAIDVCRALLGNDPKISN